MTLLLWHVAATIETRTAQARFNAIAGKYALAIERGASDSLEAVRAFRLLFRIIPQPTEAQFHDFSAPILARSSHLHSLIFIQEFAHQDRAVMERALRQRGFSQGITDFDATQGSLTPAKDHARYTIIQYAVPSDRNSHLPGYNLLSREALSQMLDRARDTGELVVLPVRPLANSNPSQGARLGIIAYLALYRGPEWWPATMEVRRRTIAGYAAVVARPEVMMERILEKAGAPEKDGVALHVYDGGQADPVALIYRRTGPAGRPVAADGPDQVQPLRKQINVAGRAWLVEATPQADTLFVSRTSSRIVLFCGLLLSLLLTALTRALNKQVVAVERMVKERTEELATSQQELHEKNTLYEALLQAQSDIGDGTFIAQDRRIVYVNDCLSAMLGYTREEFLSFPEFTAIHVSSERARIMDRYLRRLHGKPLEHQLESQLVGKQAQILDVALAAALVQWRGQPAVMVQVRDISAHKRSQERIWHMAHHDPLTNLPNRTLLKDRIQHAIAYAKRHSNLVAVLYMDLDGFKAVNDLHGHDMGDQLLVQVAKRLQQGIRESDTLARMGGDEFVILLPDLASAQDAITVAEKVISGFSTPITIPNGTELHISSSVGVCINSPLDDRPEELIKRADNVMYQAKKAGRNTYRIDAG